MRRVVLLIVVALVGAGFAGRLVGANGVSVNGTGASNATIRAELAVLQQSSSYACYIGTFVGFNTKSNANAFNAKGAAAWSRLQVEGLNVLGYVERTFHWYPTAQDLKLARSEYENDLTAEAANANPPCAGTAAEALAHLPTWFLNDQLSQNAASVEYLSRLKGAIPLTTQGTMNFYNAHPEDYDTICISYALVPAANVEPFLESRSQGMSVSNLAKKYSADPTAKSGGVYGCYPPTSEYYAAARLAVLGTPLNTFPDSGPVTTIEGGEYVQFYSPTKRTPNSYEVAAQQVFMDVQQYNAELASLGQTRILQHAQVYVDPAFGTWQAITGFCVSDEEPSKSFGCVLPLTKPAKVVTPNAGAGLAL
jgi:hypothetical protein